MKVAGIIAEYNPFHNGHKYQIDTLKEMGFDYIVVVMSGNFVQRGSCAIIDKYARTQMALACGADLVLELPTQYATASAEYFARAGVSLLEKLGVVTHLCFGAECDNLSLLMDIANHINHPTPEMQNRIRQYVKEGLSFPAARSRALSEDFTDLEIDDILASPNNILAIEYLRATSLIPILIPRKGQSYHDKNLSDLASATGIRNALMQKMPLSSIEEAMPKEAYRILERYLSTTPILGNDDLSPILYYKLLSEKHAGYTQYMDCSPNISAKIQKELANYKSFDQFVSLLKSKDITEARIRRVLLHILLNFKKDTYSETPKGQLYGRILGFCKASSALLTDIKNQSKQKEAPLPLISKVADASQVLSGYEYLLFEKDLFASNLYNQLLYAKGHVQKPNDFKQSIIIL